MDLNVDEFVDGLFKDAHTKESDTVKPEEIDFKLPEWFDENQFNKARRFFWEHCYYLSSSMLLGLIAVFSVPSILKVLVHTRRSNTSFTSYRRYLSTLLHSVMWFEHELKPGSLSWKSLYVVRSRHFRAASASKLRGFGIISQRDLALTQFGFIGYSILKPCRFGIAQREEGDWDAYNHFWRTIGYMVGLEDRYNICRSTIEETREVCQILQDRVFTPCLENVPEYFEHLAHVMLDGMWSVNPSIDVDALLYHVRYLADVPGYVSTEDERIAFQQKLREQLKGKPLDSGVDSSELMEKCAVEGLPERQPRLLYLKDYETIDNAPAYKVLSFQSKLKLVFNSFAAFMYTTYLGRLYFNLNFRFALILMKYFPYLAFFRFGVLASFVNVFKDDPTDDTIPKPNSEYYKKKPQSSWFKWPTFIRLRFIDKTAIKH